MKFKFIKESLSNECPLHTEKEIRENKPRVKFDKAEYTADIKEVHIFLNEDNPYMVVDIDNIEIKFNLSKIDIRNYHDNQIDSSAITYLKNILTHHLAGVAKKENNDN